MFSRTTTSVLAIILFFIAVVAGSPMPTVATDGNCNTGAIQCCQQTQVANGGGPITAILNLLNIIVPANVLVGLGCSPLNVIGIGQSTCSSSPVCCQNNNVGGLLSIGCLPIHI